MISNSNSNYNINVLGYYGHNNIGDEQYKLTFKYFIKNILELNNPVNFIDIDQIKDNYNILNTDIIIILLRLNYSRLY